MSSILVIINLYTVVSCIEHTHTHHHHSRMDSGLRLCKRERGGERERERGGRLKQGKSPKATQVPPPQHISVDAHTRTTHMHAHIHTPHICTR